MDAILSLAISTFEAGQTFRKAAPAYKYDALEITSFPDAMDSKDANNETTELGPKYYQRQIPEAGLLAWLREDVKSDTEHMPIMSAQPIPKASLKLLRIDRDLDVTLSIAKDCFEGIFDIMRADPSVKYMICEDYDGYHEFNGEGYLPTRFIGTGTYAIFWTFDAFTFTTRAVFIRRRLYEFFYLFSNVLRAHKSHIYNPWCLGFVSCYVTLHWSDRETSLFELKGLRHIEDKTGFGPVGKRGLKPVGMEGRFDINTLTSWSQVVNEVAGNIGNKVRHQKVSLTVLGLIAKDDGLDGIDNLPQDTLRKYRDSLDNLRRALPLLERHLATYLDFLGYLKDRSERLSAVLFALLTHEDADASITVATASKRDSSAMKTIAVMTMAFLPATFFAALFAVPSLRWDQASVIQDNFWVYWAFTLPSTALVFIVWFVITQKNWILAIVGVHGENGVTQEVLPRL